MATVHPTRFYLAERYIRMPHAELSWATVCDFDPDDAAEARQQIVILIGNADLSGITRADLVKTLEEACAEYTEKGQFGDTVNIWRCAIRNIDAMLGDLVKMGIVAYFVPDGKDDVAQVDAEACTVCMTNKKRLALECGHILFCFACADNYVASKGVFGAVCPLCAKPITKPMLNVFV